MIDNNSVFVYNSYMMIKKEMKMRGSIRLVIGFFLVFGAVGGLDAGNDVIACTALAAVGLFVMYSGVRAMEKI